MSIRIACLKGCGEPIEVSEEQLEEFRKLNAPVEASHTICPRDVEVLPSYKVMVTIYRDEPDSEPVLLAKAGGVTNSATFIDGLPELSKQLQTAWQKVLEMAPIAEMDKGQHSA